MLIGGAAPVNKDHFCYDMKVRYAFVEVFFNDCVFDADFKNLNIREVDHSQVFSFVAPISILFNY